MTPISLSRRRRAPGRANQLPLPSCRIARRRAVRMRWPLTRRPRSGVVPRAWHRSSPDRGGGFSVPFGDIAVPPGDPGVALTSQPGGHRVPDQWAYRFRLRTRFWGKPCQAPGATARAVAPHSSIVFPVW